MNLEERASLILSYLAVHREGVWRFTIIQDATGHAREMDVRGMVEAFEFLEREGMIKTD